MKKDIRRAVIAGNWKMNKTRPEAKELIEALKPLVKDAGCEVVICVPFTNLETAVELTKGTNIKVGAQNCPFAKGRRQYKNVLVCPRMAQLDSLVHERHRKHIRRRAQRLRHRRGPVSVSVRLDDGAKLLRWRQRGKIFGIGTDMIGSDNRNCLLHVFPSLPAYSICREQKKGNLQPLL